ncbi:transcriptional regulator [Phyllobacterium phragmitis]|uniref:Transcriptional regulator n=1 Tax=Phyllobacterium phragmitis TaxID=2670329 RepID=A0A2S9IQE4_9HYPH|nr:transcriptional regulator GutM [Phyllobacterium phragmitis]PRD42747.1 transcriptional regulator [Phyllobacterium phragmitis]
MAIWQWGLLALAVVWALQSLGVWFQMRHYSDVLKGVTSKYADGFVGAGNCRGRFGKGVIVLIVVTPDLVVRRLLEMSGRSVFAKFRRREEFEGMTLDALRADPKALGEAKPGVAEAIKKAIEQIDRMRSEPKEKPGLAGLKTVGA